MRDGIALLSDRETDVLRLLGRGHDAKSAAAELGLSVHTVNDHLREARRKLGVTSSRAAARILIEAGGAPPESLGIVKLRMATPPDAVSDRADPGRAGVVVSIALLAGALAMLAIALIAVALSRPTPAEPSVVATVPAAGSVIAPGAFTLSVTFDRPMRDRSYSFVQISPDTYPDCPGKPSASHDRRTFTLACTARAARRYEIWFNRQPYMNFRSISGAPARSYRLTFATRPD